MPELYQTECELMVSITRSRSVGTVDSSQGTENKVIILHAVRGQVEENRPLGQFLNDFRRLNVATSRGQMFLFVVGNIMA